MPARSSQALGQWVEHRVHLTPAHSCLEVPLEAACSRATGAYLLPDSPCALLSASSSAFTADSLTDSFLRPLFPLLIHTSIHSRSPHT